ncbi:MAG: hypothetical protein L3K26_08750, partial [Candidatus Hydrogenedentes bacterium]|nr:hypothetical protein [Candidatus Hydrogenedentota bacterium]
SGATCVYGKYIDEVLQMQRNTDGQPGMETHYYLHDDLFNVIGLADDTGTLQERYEYGDYGMPAVYDAANGPLAESAFQNAYLFNGRRFDSDTGLYYYRTRYMNPEIGRFISRDTIGLWGDENNLGNPYTYAGNNPWSNLDPFGEDVVDDFNPYSKQKWGIAEGMGRLPFQAAAATVRFTSQDVHTALQGMGMVPVAGIVFDGADVLFYIFEGNLVEAGKSALATPPVLGQVLRVGGSVLGAATVIVGIEEIVVKGVALKVARTAENAAPAKPGRFIRGWNWITGKNSGPYVLFNKTHSGSLPNPKGFGPNGGRLQSHHGVQNAWAAKNLPGYDPKLAPTVTLETGKGHSHTIITNRQKERRDARIVAGQGKWGSTIDEELSHTVGDFHAAGFGDDVIKQVLEQNYSMLDKLGVVYSRPAGF